MLSLIGEYNTIGKRLTKWINYLQDSDWKNRVNNDVWS